MNYWTNFINGGKSTTTKSKKSKNAPKGEIEIVYAEEPTAKSKEKNSEVAKSVKNTPSASTLSSDNSTTNSKVDTSTAPTLNAEKGKETVENSSKSPSETPDNKSKKARVKKLIKISKIGTDHIKTNLPNQDYVFAFLNLKIVTDGCGSGHHSQVGTHIFAQLFSREVATFIKCVNENKRVQLMKYVKNSNPDTAKLLESLNKGQLPEEALIGIINSIMDKMLFLCSDSKFIFDNYCFTILICLEYDDEFVTYTCGDGFVITETADEITFEELDPDAEYPAYYIYNYISPEDLICYQSGVDFIVTRYSKQEYQNIGVASDGLRFYEELLDPELQKLCDNLSRGRAGQIEMLINRNNNSNKIFKDDISICF